MNFSQKPISLQCHYQIVPEKSELILNKDKKMYCFNNEIINVCINK